MLALQIDVASTAKGPMRLPSPIPIPGMSLSARRVGPIRNCSRLIVAAGLTMLIIVPTTVAVRSDGLTQHTAGKEWPTVSGDSANTRHSTLSQINIQNVARLGGAWTKKFDDLGAAR